jgi:hypothetical protein
MHKENRVYIYNRVLICHNEWNYVVYGKINGTENYMLSEINLLQKDKYYMFFSHAQSRP